MREIFRVLCLLFVLVVVYTSQIVAQSNSVVKVYEKLFKTYPFSDPNPIPDPSNRIYPYFRFDGFTERSEPKTWKVIELENDFIKLLILPQMGGKIWSAIDKKTGKPFVYENDVIKFRDIAMRGAWTSGGIEMNYGILGHTPGVATPVNYMTRENNDGSVSCILSLLDLLTDTKWSLEIRLPKDKAYFVTKSFWHNKTSTFQPYYHWMNMAWKVSDSLHYIFPGNAFLRHSGAVEDWPIDKETEKNLSYYSQKNFGGGLSAHVVGKYSKYFGVYEKEDDYGMIHFSNREDKIGKKIFIWGLSRHGMIWENVLSDKAGQYTEIQSGRLFNQNKYLENNNPFQQFFFMPFNTDVWTEYWYPFMETRGVVHADLNGVFNLVSEETRKIIFISPVAFIDDTLRVWDDKENLILQQPLFLNPLESYHQSFTIGNDVQISKIVLGNSKINLLDEAQKELSRPLKSSPDFNWKSAYGLMIRGRTEAGIRNYELSESLIRASLEKSPFLIRALTAMSYLQFMKMNYDSSFYFAKSALSVDTYDPEANYYYGLAAAKLHRLYDAEDGFQVATFTPFFRAAAYTELSKIQFLNDEYNNAYESIKKSLINNTNNITALQLKYLIARLTNRKDEEETTRKELLANDPLNDFIRFEAYLKERSEGNKNEFINMIRDELPQESYLDLAVWYHNLGRDLESREVLELCPVKSGRILYWLAWLYRDEDAGKIWLYEADKSDPNFDFSFRSETEEIMNWAMTKTTNWRPKYYSALIKKFKGHKQESLEYLQSIKNDPLFPPFYVLRARLRNGGDTSAIISDYQRAISLNNIEWRYGRYLAEYLISINRPKEAIDIILPYSKKFPENYVLQMVFIRSLILDDQYELADKVLDDLKILPFEGDRNGHNLYERVKLMLAMESIQKRKYKEAQRKVKASLEWPERLGVGKPFPADINIDLQNEILKMIQNLKKGNNISERQIRQLIERIKEIPLA